MKSRQSLQNELEKILAGTPALNLLSNPNKVWDDQEMREAAWIVEDFVNQNPAVIEDDNRLRDWLDKYRFHMATVNRP